MKVLFTIAACCLFAAPAAAQENGESARTKIQKKVEAMRKAMREGKVRKFNVFVTVKLKNGNRMKGVVKSGKFVELQDGIDFVSAAEIEDKRAGMRVWYTVGTTSYVFLRYEEIEHYSIGSKLSDAQVKAIEIKIAQELTETRDNYRRMQDLRKQKEDARNKAAGAGKVGKTTDPDAPPALKAEDMKLLQEFPAKEGWGAEKVEKLKTRRLTLGVYPNEKERRFETVFVAWKAAFDAQEKILAYKKKASNSGAVEKAKDVPVTTETPANSPGATPLPGKPPK